ncbi:WGR domain-containing protein [Acidithiobacillus ferridurans]|uniref:WGR domain-containing protein n=1 Tax=Acidithiobacillus ferridurans TaxID=1232575 RepID=UPI001C067D61|nr:WGR domain-containing protein [Acidithiobacillus ferridurans]MBU2717844.1 WGR domain-containing protein [Acidithiobacillus ferridurans]MBU2732615.1 WGR domain-containing protein [Acidithiobacillus ferridurans]
MPESQPDLDYAVCSWWIRRWEKVDPESGRRRFYTAELRQDLWGDWLFIKAWGRIGQKPSRVVIVSVSNPGEALELVDGVAKVRRQRHYEEKPC